MIFEHYLSNDKKSKIIISASNLKIAEELLKEARSSVPWTHPASLALPENIVLVNKKSTNEVWWYIYEEIEK